MFGGIVTKTSESAIQCLTYLALNQEETLMSPKRIAESLGLSPTYMAKITGLLSKADILHAQRGATGGVGLEKPPSQITLLEVIEAFQGKLIPHYCLDIEDPTEACGFHQAMLDLHTKTIETLSKWTLADIVRRPCPGGALEGTVQCRMERVVTALPFLPRRDGGLPNEGDLEEETTPCGACLDKP